MMNEADLDVILIGAGHNGLVAASYLARAGLKVCVVEAHPEVGGGCVTEPLFTDAAVSTGDTLVSLFSPQVAAELKLAARGVELVSHEVAVFAPALDGSSVLLYHEPNQSAHEISRHSLHDAEAYLRFESFLDAMEARLAPWWMRQPPTLEELARAFSGHEGEWMLRDLMFSSVAELLDEYFERDAIKAAVGARGVLGSFAGPRTPGTAYPLITQSLGRIAGRRGAWAQVRGGLGRLAAALAEAATEQGAQLITGERVTQIEVFDGRAHGVRLASGESMRASWVLSSADPRTTFLRLLSREHLPAQFVSRVEQYPTRGSSMRIELLLGDLPDFRARPGSAPAPHHHGRLLIAPSLDYMHQAFGDARVGRCSTAPIISGYIPTLQDPKLAPSGCHLMSLDVQFAPYHLADESWSQLREGYADHVLTTLARYAPNLPRIILERRVWSPLDLEQRFSVAWGHAHHGDMRPGCVMSFRPVPGWAAYRTPLPGLYLCGAGAHPGGGITGLPGRNAAYALLEDLSNHHR
jgi:phytoene dehydrogenase-like protein